jgi:hypothetical protein
MYTVNQAYWMLMGWLVFLLGTTLMLGCLLAYPGSIFYGEGWIYGSTAVWAMGALMFCYAPIVCD